MIIKRQDPAAKESPLISCLLPTRNRTVFVRQALRCFSRQKYDNRELIVLDDGEESVEDICVGNPQVRYLHFPNRETLGTKLNLGAEMAAGDFIQKLDDDDYYAPGFLSRVARQIRTSNEKDTVFIWDCFLVLLQSSADELRFSGHGWKPGGTLGFTRSTWQNGHFRDLSIGEDKCFLEDHQNVVHKICCPELYILVRHHANTWTITNGGSYVDLFLGTLPVYGRSLSEIIPKGDMIFYRTLRGLASSAPQIANC